MVKQNLTDKLVEEIYSKAAKKIYDTNKTVVKQIDSICLDPQDMAD